MTKAVAVIPTLNEANTIDLAFEGLARQTKPPDLVLVMDGGSTDGTRERARVLGDHLGLDVEVGVRDEGSANIGLSCAAGIVAAGEHFEQHAPGGDGVIVRTDADSVLAADWIETAANRLSDPETVMFGPVTMPLYMATGERTRPGEGLAHIILSGLTNLRREPAGRAQAFRWSDFDAVNGFCLCDGETCNCAPGWYEDTILREKLEREGRVVFSTATTVYTEMPPTTLTSPRKWVKHQNFERKVAEMDWTPRV